jgi:hypothetical protein
MICKINFLFAATLSMASAAPNYSTSMSHPAELCGRFNQLDLVVPDSYLKASCMDKGANAKLLLNRRGQKKKTCHNMGLWAQSKGWTISKSEQPKKEILALRQEGRAEISIRCVNYAKNGAKASRLVIVLGEGEVTAPAVAEPVAEAAPPNSADPAPTAELKPEICIKAESFPDAGKIVGVLESYSYEGGADAYEYKIRQQIPACMPVPIYVEGTPIQTASGHKIDTNSVGKPIAIEWSKQKGTHGPYTQYIAVLPEGEPSLKDTLRAQAKCPNLPGPNDYQYDYLVTGILQAVTKTEELTRMDGTKYRPEYIAHKYKVELFAKNCSGGPTHTMGWDFGPMPLDGGGQLLEDSVGKIVRIWARANEMEKFGGAVILD